MRFPDYAHKTGDAAGNFQTTRLALDLRAHLPLYTRPGKSMVRLERGT
jgi:hypothetical protein